ncbi:MAG: hypothetical protein Q7K43_03060, partial [Candidatus Woesearchaeota archaeon]|nr:hypothetical protein [Candidatus Woesearchaeota archaeon]
MSEIIRVSCNGFVNLQLEGRVLGLLARSRLPERVYSPIGGGLEYCFSEQRLLEEFLANLNATLEKPNTKDLRLNMPESSLDKFSDWFYKGTEREISPQRELEQELCAQEFEGV